MLRAERVEQMTVSVSAKRAQKTIRLDREYFQVGT